MSHLRHRLCQGRGWVKGMTWPAAGLRAMELRRPLPCRTSLGLTWQQEQR